MLYAAIALGALLVGAAVPSPLRDGSRALLLFLFLMAPIVAIGVGIAHWDHAKVGTWFGLVPLTIVWLGWFELRFGFSARLAHRPDVGRPRRGAPSPDVATRDAG